MFNWYRNAAVCYIFLEDVPPSDEKTYTEHAFRNSRWLTRGWTLQEYLAPSHIELYSSSWTRIGSVFSPCSSMELELFEASLVQRCTGIHRWYWSTADISTRLSWAATRHTTREEDKAYCLLGLLDVKMPLLYGEGDEAFPRLLEEVIKKSNSHGVLAAGYNLPWSRSTFKYPYLLPTSPRPYAGCRNGFEETPVPGRSNSPHFTLTNAGLSIELPLLMIDDRLKVVLGLLNCRDKSKPDSLVAIVLVAVRGVQYSQYSPVSHPLSVPSEFHQLARRKKIYIANERSVPLGYRLQIDYADLGSLGYSFGGIYPPSGNWNTEIGFTIRLTKKMGNTLVLLFTTTGDSPNIVVFISQVFSRHSTAAPLVSLTNSISLIEFLLKPDNVGQNQEPRASSTVQQSSTHKSKSPFLPLGWSDRVDLQDLERCDFWSHAVEIFVPESPRVSEERYRVSAILNHHQHLDPLRDTQLIMDLRDLSVRDGPLSEPNA
jgi:hypothetical protein